MRQNLVQTQLAWNVPPWVCPAMLAEIADFFQVTRPHELDSVLILHTISSLPHTSKSRFLELFTGSGISLAFSPACEVKKCQTEPQSVWTLDHKLSYLLLCGHGGQVRLAGESLQRSNAICKSTPKRAGKPYKGRSKLATTPILIQVSYRGNETLFQDNRTHASCICACFNPEAVGEKEHLL